MPQGEKNRRLTDEQRREIVRLYQSRNPDGSWISTGDLARRFGVANTCILYNLKRDGVAIRSNSEAHRGKACKPIKNIPQGEPPICKCGCEQATNWNRRKNGWDVYCPGHYRRDAPYKHLDWWEAEYIAKGRMIDDLAAEQGVVKGSILKAARKLSIPLRTQGQSLALSGAMSGANNPAWKGDVAKWEYAPDWKRIARCIRKRDNYTCQLCKTTFPKSSKLLHVHHIDGDKTHNADSNLLTVCATCHPKGKRKETAAFVGK